MGGIGWGGIPSDRVVAVVARLDTGQVQIGSGYLVSERLVLTARHCVVDKKTLRAARSLRVSRRSGGPEAVVTLRAAGSQLDVAVLAVEDPLWAVTVASEPPLFGRVDRSRAGELHGCQAIGFPLWQLDPQDRGRNAAELHGMIRATEDVEPGLLVMRDPLLLDVAIPDTVTAEDRADRSAWGGLSGALVFHEGMALGVVIEHRPWKGGSALTILPVERFASGPAGGDPSTVAVAAALGLPPADKMPLAGGQPLAELVEVSIHGRLPRVDELNPYQLGATPSAYGNVETYGQHDQYIPRSKDESLAAALGPGRRVVLVGPSKAGKTRTAFEVMRGHSIWGGAFLVAPKPQALGHLAEHPALGGSDPVVIWLDELQRFLPPAGDLSQAVISRLFDRPGPSVLLATIRPEQLELLRGPVGEMTREVRLVVDNVTRIELASTRKDPSEQARAAAVYPEAGYRPEGLAEVLAGAPDLLSRYRNSADAEPPLLHTLVQTCIDWARCGLARPIPESVLLDLARDVLERDRADLDVHEEEFGEALRQARKPIAGGGQIALLRTQRLPDRSRGYWPFDYLVAADDGQNGEARPVAESTWQGILGCAAEEDGFSIGLAAHLRGNIPVALAATLRAAEAGDTGAQNNLGLMLANNVDPPLVAEARSWWTRAARAGDPGAQMNLGTLLTTMLDPPEISEARAWFTTAAEAGYPEAQFRLGTLLVDQAADPLPMAVDSPEMAEARTWLARAAEAGHTEAQYRLGAMLAYWVNPPALSEARAWWTRAGDAGHVEAQFRLGRLLGGTIDSPEVTEERVWLMRAAEAGHTEAQLHLGLLLVYKADPPEVPEGRAWLTRAAEAGNAEAQYALGALLAYGTPPELAEARTWWTKAAEAGYTEAQFCLAALLADQLNPPEPAEARAWYTKAAEAGHTGAQLNLGLLLAYKLDPPEPAEARAWYTKAAEAGNIGASYCLGALLAYQVDPPQVAEARAWWTQAAAAGDTHAQWALGGLLADLMEPGELPEARTWYTKAAEAGDTDAQYRLGGLLADRFDPPELAEARIWYTQAAEAGHADAQFALGNLLAYRINPPDIGHACMWWTKAAEAGDANAQYSLGVLLATKVDPPELAEARVWWTKAAEAGDPKCMYNLGVLLATMVDPPELAEARVWWAKAAEAGLTDAQYHLGLLLADRIDPPELAEARAWLTRAAEAGHTDARSALEQFKDS